MSNLNFNGKSGWFCPPKNKYGLSTKEVKDITLDNFSFLARVKPNWDRIRTIPYSHKECGIIIKNGKHTGISAIVNEEGTKFFIKGTVWTKVESNVVMPVQDGDVLEFKELAKNEEVPTDILLRVNWGPNDLEKEFDLGFTYNKKEKKLSLYCNGQWETKTFEGELIDYSNSWLWVGVCNPLESCPEEFRHFYFGTMNYVGIYQECLTKEEIVNTFKDTTTINKNLNPVCIFDFEKHTPYKVLDVTYNGNNIIKFDKTWMHSI